MGRNSINCVMLCGIAHYLLFSLLHGEQCIAHLEKDMAVAMRSEQGVYFQEGVVSDIAIESGIMLVSTERPMVLTSPTLLPFSSRILEMIVLNFTDDGSSSDPRWHGDAPSVQRQDGRTERLTLGLFE